MPWSIGGGLRNLEAVKVTLMVLAQKEPKFSKAYFPILSAAEPEEAAPAGDQICATTSFCRQSYRKTIAVPVTETAEVVGDQNGKAGYFLAYFAAQATF